MGLLTNKYALIGAACAGLGIAFMLYKGAGKAVDLVKEGAEAINPLNHENVINQGFNSIYQGATGSDGTLGTDIYDATHGGALDVTSSNNIINRGVNGIGGALTGEEGWTLGGAIYDWTHWK